MAPLTVLPADHERHAVTAAAAFIQGRMEERATVKWALNLKTNDAVKRAALQDILGSLRGLQIRQPWQSAWRIIEQSWVAPAISRRGAGAHYRILERIKIGDRSGSLISDIIELVRPGISVSSARPNRKIQRPRSVGDILAIWLTSGEIVDPTKIGLSAIGESQFLTELAHGLDAEVVKALDTASRLGWKLGHGLSRLGAIHRVYFVPLDERRSSEHEPDEFHRGIAPLVKLLYAAVSGLTEMDLGEALKFAGRWQAAQTPLHNRLWAACARDVRVATAAEVGAFLRNCDDPQFWYLHYYPEIAELRALRFGELGENDQRDILARLKKLPPRSHWPSKVGAKQVKEVRQFWLARELRRIEIAGATLPDNMREWLSNWLKASSELSSMSRVDEGFLGMPQAQWAKPNPDDQYELLEGINRLRALEVALSSGARVWDGNPATRAWDWIRQDDHAERLLDDLEAAPKGGGEFPKVWDHFGRALATPVVRVGERKAEADVVVSIRLGRVVTLLAELPDDTTRGGIEGITQFFATWARLIVGIEGYTRVWFRLWPIAVSATNDQEPIASKPILNIASESDDREPLDLDTLNTPVGRLVGVLLAACPRIEPGDRPFDANFNLRAMRDVAVLAPGHSGIIARHRMIESLSWFVAADPEWTESQLLAPLRADTYEAQALWRALARHTRFTDVLNVIGDLMAERANDRRLGRETGRSLVWSLVIESLHAYKDSREPAVPHARVQQMLRSLDDEVRAHAARAVHGFIANLAGQTEGSDLLPSAESLFRSAAQPFLEQVWPQERSLTTPGIAGALSRLPSVCGDAFGEAVDTIGRFLMPFPCYTMTDYGFHGDQNSGPRLDQVDNPAKAEAFLHLLDRTIGTAEGSIIPYDLGDALDQVQRISPALVRTSEFRRLATLTRR